MTVVFLLLDLAQWMHWRRAPQSLRPILRQRALVCLVFFVMFGGWWALLSFPSGARIVWPTVPWWLAAIVVLCVLLSLGLALAELRRTLSLRHKGV